MASLIAKLNAARSGLLTTGGLGFGTASAWVALDTWAGLLATGASLIVLEWLARDDTGTGAKR